jgi:uncharacterized repeat protein (TIGR03803 family)
MTRLLVNTLSMALVTVAAVVLHAATTPTVTELFGFASTNNYANGHSPRAPLVQGSDGNFYGTSYFGGDDGNHCSGGCAGTVFKITPAGQFTRLHTFAFATPAARVGGGYPTAGVVEGPDGYLYGTTSQGGNGFAGTIFKISKTGQFQKLHDFCPQGLNSGCPDGYTPSAGLVLGGDGNLYGATITGGLGSNNGVFFRISSTGSFSAIASFAYCTLAVGSSCVNGMTPTGLVLASDGNFYGLSARTVFRVTSSGKVTVIHIFDNLGGPYQPNGSLIQAKNGMLYGVTTSGGAHNAGFVYQITVSGTFQSMYDLPGAGKGSVPNTLLQASDGNLWGTTVADTGNSGYGWVYSITTAGASLTSVHLSSAVGFTPDAPLIQATNGNLYGTAFEGGRTNPCCSFGSIFVVSAGLAAPKPSVTNSGLEMTGTGGTLAIHGSNFTGATGVLVDGRSVDFEVTSDGVIKATLPSGVTGNRIEVLGPDGSSSASEEFETQ